MVAIREHLFLLGLSHLICGLPHQAEESFSRTLGTVIAMQPDRLAVYNYAHLSKQFKGHQMIKERDLPSPDVKLKILNRMIEKLCSASYIYIGMDHSIMHAIRSFMPDRALANKGFCLGIKFM